MREIIKKHPSVCYTCTHARKPWSLENVKKGYVGCICDKPIDFTSPEHGRGWVDLKTRISLDSGSGIVSNGILITKEVKECKNHEMDQDQFRKSYYISP